VIQLLAQEMLAAWDVARGAVPPPNTIHRFIRQVAWRQWSRAQTLLDQAAGRPVTIAEARTICGQPIEERQLPRLPPQRRGPTRIERYNTGEIAYYNAGYSVHDGPEL
jgi:hypothetical protein